MLNDFKKYRNRVTCMIRKANRTYHIRKFNNTTSSKLFWKQVKEIGIAKTSSNTDSEELDINALSN